jgi:hypothetical protein
MITTKSVRRLGVFGRLASCALLGFVDGGLHVFWQKLKKKGAQLGLRIVVGSKTEYIEKKRKKK